MNTVLLVMQVLVALVFLMAGFMKATQPKEKLAERMAWVEDFSPGQIRAIGILELLGALAIIVSGVLGLLPWLAPLAAAGLALTMIGAILTRVRRKEYGSLVMNIVLLLAAAAVAYAGFAGALA